jgi:SAM-dependent methyltransferase
VRYDAALIAAFFDRYGEREWERLERTPADRVSLHLHTRFLERFIQPGDRVLEAGAGPGRFTTELARLGARVVVGDISQAQLKLNERYVREAGAERAVLARQQLDITALGSVADGRFDAVVCFGGPLSYVMERADDALAELLRALRPGGVLLVSVMSLIGATRMSLEQISTLSDYPEVVSQVARDGLLAPELVRGQPMKLYRASELRALLTRHGAEVLAASAANCLSVGRDAFLSAELSRPGLWESLLTWEEDFCAEPGNLDAGTHILMAARKEAA